MANSLAQEEMRSFKILEDCRLQTVATDAEEWGEGRRPLLESPSSTALTCEERGIGTRLSHARVSIKELSRKPLLYRGLRGGR
jgi:hypothetical protein